MASSRKSSMARTGNTIKEFFNSLFCGGKQEEEPEPEVLHNRPATKSKQFIHLSLLGSYKTSSLCKMTRKNFIGSMREMSTSRLPSSVFKFLSERIRSTNVITKGDIGQRYTRIAPFIIKLDDKQKIKQKYGASPSKIYDQVLLYRPKHPILEPLSLLQTHQTLGEELYEFAQKFKNSVFVLPPQIILDQIGVLFGDLNKFVEIQSIVINGKLMYYFVYVGDRQFAILTQQQQISFIIKELQKDLKEENPNIEQVVKQVFKKSSIKELLFLLRKSINQSYTETVLSCFCRNALFRQYIQPQQIQKLPNLERDGYSQNRLTAQFNQIRDRQTNLSVIDDLLNAKTNSFLYENYVETLVNTGSIMTEIEENSKQ